MLDATNCPVCGMRVDVTAGTPSSQHDGEKYFFCGKSCKQAFDREPQKYLAAH